MATIKPKTKPAKKEKISKTKTLTGQKAAEIIIRPHLYKMDGNGVPIKEELAVIIRARMNPPTLGHERLVNEAYDTAIAEGGVPFIFLSGTIDKHNPLTFNTKVELVKEAFGDRCFVVEEPVANLIDVLKVVSEHFKNVIWITGSDQVDEYTRIAENYNNKDFVFEEIEVRSLDRDGENLSENISATQMRQAVLDKDVDFFKHGLPENIKEDYESIFESTKRGLELFMERPRTLEERVKHKLKVKQYIVNG